MTIFFNILQHHGSQFNIWALIVFYGACIVRSTYVVRFDASMAFNNPRKLSICELKV